MATIASPNEIIYFIELSKTLNFSRASERLGISQPSLSVAIKRLEESIGAPLFIRSKSGVTLTQAGKRLQLHGQKMIQLWDAIKAESLASHHEVQGSVRFGCHSSVALYTLPKFMPDLLNQYPALDIQLQHDLSRKILEGVINLSIDIGIVVNPVQHPDLILRKLYNDKVSFFCAASIKNTHALIESGDVVIACDPELSQTQSLLKKFNKIKKNRYRILATSNLEVIANFASYTNFIGILPASVAASVKQLKLKEIAELPFYQDEIYLAYRIENRDIRAVAEIVKAVKESF